MANQSHRWNLLFKFLYQNVQERMFSFAFGIVNLLRDMNVRTSDPKCQDPGPKSQTLDPKSQTTGSKSQTPDPKPSFCSRTLYPKPRTLNPAFVLGPWTPDPSSFGASEPRIFNSTRG